MPEINTPLLRKVLDHITAHPDEWDQDRWWDQSACGTVGCLAGWTAHFTEIEMDKCDGLWSTTADPLGVRHVSTIARHELGLTDEQAAVLFAEGNELRDLYELANCYTGGDIEIPDQLPDGS